ncbi:MAG: ABC transporter permease subunit [Candidatus Jettenia sp. CY-1]|nr:MAG: ABC transporter permease subunit [Candidatus Jettenia sp. CY-1]
MFTILLTIASHTFREAIRKKILHVLIGLGILIMAVVSIVPTTDEPDARIKIMLVVFFQVVVVLCMIGIILLSATSLPHEIEDRTIYGILSKPISRLKVIAGKILGFTLVSALVLVILSFFNIVAVQRITTQLPGKCQDIVKARNECKVSQFFIQGKPHHISEGIVWIEGGRTGIAVWNFSDVYKKLNSKFSLEAEFHVKIESSRDFIDTIPLAVRIENTVSGQGKTEVLSGKADEPFNVRIDPDIVQDNSAVTITIFPVHKTDYIGVTPGDVRVFSVQKGFVSNYTKAIFITFLKFFLIVVIAVMGSTYLSAPVNILSSLIIFLCGHVLDFIKDFSFLIQNHDLHGHSSQAVSGEPNIFLIYLNSVMEKVLEWFSVILPDFKKYDSLQFLLKGINIPLETVEISLGYTALYAGICLIISSILFKKREFF